MKNRLHQFIIKSKVYFSKDFDHPAFDLSAFIFSIDEFIISQRRNERLIHYKTDQTQEFRDWLLRNGVRDVLAN